MRPHYLLRDLGKEIGRIVAGDTEHHETLRRRLATALFATLVFDAMCTLLMHWFEISSWFKSFFWVTTQLLTVSSQMQNPLTTGGRIVDIGLELWALTVVTAVAGSFAAFLVKK
jgi:hypothetical protein